MKVSPVAGAPPQSVNPNEGSSIDPDRRARALAVAQGSSPDERGPATDPQVERAQNSIKRIKLRTQQSTDRHQRVDAPAASLETEIPADGAGTQESDKEALGEPAAAASEATKPLSPQFAALAKQRREIQLAQQKLDADKAALTTQSGDTKSLEEYRARIKANALSVLLEEGVTYDQLTEQILASNQDSPDLTALKSDIKSLKEGLENQTKTLTAREAQQKAQVLAQIERNVNQLVSQGDEFEMIREAGYAPKVVELIDRTFEKTGEVLDETEAATLIEGQLLEESLKFARLKKVQQSLKPAPAQAAQVPQQDRPGTKTMRTLTNRDGVSSTTMSKRERAIAAMEGRLK